MFYVRTSATTRTSVWLTHSHAQVALHAPSTFRRHQHKAIETVTDSHSIPAPPFLKCEQISDRGGKQTSQRLATPYLNAKTIYY